MSMIKCPECNHTVSSKADKCPECGVAIAGNVKRCPVCGGFVLMAAVQCPHCWTDFKVEGQDDKQQPTPVKEESQQEKKPQVQSDKQPQKEAPSSSQLTDSSKAPAEPDKSSSHLGCHVYLLVIILLVALIGGFILWENQNQEASEQEAFALLKDCTNPENFNDFIARFPESDYVPAVRQRLQELKKADEQWFAIYASGGVQDLKEYLKAHPSTLHKKEALRKIDSLDWREADRVATMAAFDAYIEQHPNGDFLDLAYSAKERARLRAEQAARDSVQHPTDSTAAIQTAPAVPAAPAAQ